MKRILLSLAGGIVIPILYFIVVGLIISILNHGFWNVGGDSWWLWVAFLPIEWSGHIYNRLFPSEPAAVFAPRGEVILASIITNFVVYSLLTYIMLWWRDNRRRVSRAARPTTA